MVRTAYSRTPLTREKALLYDECHTKRTLAVVCFAPEKTPEGAAGFV
jgi:hypothetical protein